MEPNLPNWLAAVEADESCFQEPVLKSTIFSDWPGILGFEGTVASTPALK
jgi:hypothetical protein